MRPKFMTLLAICALSVIAIWAVYCASANPPSSNASISHSMRPRSASSNTTVAIARIADCARGG